MPAKGMSGDTLMKASGDIGVQIHFELQDLYVFVGFTSFCYIYHVIVGSIKMFMESFIVCITSRMDSYEFQRISMNSYRVPVRCVFMASRCARAHAMSGNIIFPVGVGHPSLLTSFPVRT
jgi:hypothetical protein